MELFYNSKTKKLKEQLLKEGEKVKIRIASAFFSNSAIIKDFLNNGCEIELLVRLNKGTSPSELKKVLDYNSHKILIKYFTSEKFHPKFYIFDNRIAFIGSSNLTNSGIASNQEMNIKIDDVTILEELNSVFVDYWNKAKTLTAETVDKFNKILIKEEYKDKNPTPSISEVIGNIEYTETKNEEREYMYYCIGDGAHRCFEDYVKYGFIAAGQASEKHHLYGKELLRLKKDDIFFAYNKRHGYVGVGKVVEEAVPIDKYKVEPNSDKKLYDLPLQQGNIKENHDNDKCEWIVKVEWIKTVTDKNNAFKFKGIFTSRSVACRIDKNKHVKTIQFLEDKFGL